MAYARGFKRTGRRGSGGTVSLRRKRPTARKISRKLKTTRSRKVAVAKNTVAIRKLASKVNAGPIHKQLQFTQVPAGISNGMEPNVAQPICHLMNDFTRFQGTGRHINQNGGIWYKGGHTNGTDGYLSEANKTGQWHLMQPGFQSGFDPVFQQWSNDDNIPSHISYTPLSSKTILNFKVATWVKQQSPLRIRIDIIRPKRVVNYSSKNKFQLPECLGAFGQMAVPLFHENANTDKLDANQYDRTKWMVKTKWVTLNAPLIGKESDGTVNNVNKTVVINMTFPKAKLHTNLEYDDELVSPYSPGLDEVYLNIKTHQQVWMIISVSENQATGATDLICNARREIRWRDNAPEVF